MKILTKFLVIIFGLLFVPMLAKAKTEIRIPGNRAVIEIRSCDCNGVTTLVYLLRCEGEGGYCIIIILPDRSGDLARAELYDNGNLIQTKYGTYCGAGESGDPQVDAYFWEHP